MKCALIFTLLAAAASSILAAPLEVEDSLLSGLTVEQQPEQDVVKRQVPANPDSALKQISFQTLIGNLEDSLFQSALSLSGASAPDSQVAEVTPDQSTTTEGNQHVINKRSNENEQATTEIVALHEDAQERKILLQTTKKVPLSEDGVPAHLIIDHVSVQPHNSAALPLIPLFQVHHTKITSATIKEDPSNDSSDGKQTKISITKTSITSTAPVESVEAQSSSTSSNPESVGSSTTTTEQTTGSSSTTTTTTTAAAAAATTTTTSTTSENPVQQLKDEEKKLKEKVAEVEAEPVILTSRV